METFLYENVVINDGNDEVDDDDDDGDVDKTKCKHFNLHSLPI